MEKVLFAVLLKDTAEFTENTRFSLAAARSLMIPSGTEFMFTLASGAVKKVVKNGPNFFFVENTA